jgi:hypothetical protein
MAVLVGKRFSYGSKVVSSVHQYIFSWKEKRMFDVSAVAISMKDAQGTY